MPPGVGLEQDLLRDLFRKVRRQYQFCSVPQPKASKGTKGNRTVNVIL